MRDRAIHGLQAPPVLALTREMDSHPWMVACNTELLTVVTKISKF